LAIRPDVRWAAAAAAWDLKMVDRELPVLGSEALVIEHTLAVVWVIGVYVGLIFPRLEMEIER
jgi:hypothetical protein